MSLNMSFELDKKFNFQRSFPTLSQRDVPGECLLNTNLFKKYGTSLLPVWNYGPIYWWFGCFISDREWIDQEKHWHFKTASYTCIDIC